MPNNYQFVSLPENDGVKLDQLATSLISLLVILESLHKAEYIPRIHGRFHQLSSLVVESYTTVISQIIDAVDQVTTFRILLQGAVTWDEDSAQSSSDLASGIFNRYLSTHVAVENVRRRLNKVLEVLIIESKILLQDVNSPESFVNVPVPLKIDHFTDKEQQTGDLEPSPSPRLTEGKSLNDLLSLIYRTNDTLDGVEECLDRLQSGWSDVCVKLGGMGATGLDSLHAVELGQHWTSYIEQTRAVKRLLHSTMPIKERPAAPKPQAFVALSSLDVNVVQDPSETSTVDDINMPDLAKLIDNILKPQSYTRSSTQKSQVLWKEMLRRFTQSGRQSLEAAEEVHKLSVQGSDLCTSLQNASMPENTDEKAWGDMSNVARDTEQKYKSTLSIFRKMRSDIFQVKRTDFKTNDDKNEPSSSQIAAASSSNEGEATPERVVSHIFSDSDFQDLYQVIDRLCSVWNGLDLKAGSLVAGQSSPITNTMGLRIRLISESWTYLKDATGDYRDQLKDIDFQEKPKDINLQVKQFLELPPFMVNQSTVRFLTSSQKAATLSLSVRREDFWLF